MPAYVVFALLAACPVLAQVTLGAGGLGGTVLDGSGAVVAGAEIKLIETSKGLVRTSETGADGYFLFTPVLAGEYSLEAAKAGFRIERMNGLRINVGERFSVTLNLQLEGLRMSVAAVPPSDTELSAESNQIGTLVDSYRVRELPLNGRNFLQLAVLSGGSNEVSTASDVFSSNVGPPGRTVVLPGAFPYSANYSLNGFVVRSSRDGELALSPSIAAVDEFKVQSGFLMPDQGTGFAVVNIVTKSGSNGFHGEFYEFVRNKVLDARSFFAPAREDLRRNQFGAAVGGPVKKDRIWFHAFYEGLRELSAFSVAGYSPTSEMFGGNLSATGRAIYDPASYSPNAPARQPFAAATIPASRINPVSRNLLAYYRPGSSLASRPNNIDGTPERILRDDQGGIRFDATVSPRSQLFGQYFRQATPSMQPGLFPLSGLAYQNESSLAMLQHTWTVSSNAVNNFRFGFLRSTAVGGNEAREMGPILDTIGVINTFSRSGVTAVALQGYSGFGRANGDVGNNDNTWQLDEQFALSRRGHTMAFGAGIRYRRGWHLNGNAVAHGSLTFQPVFTSQLTLNGQGQTVPVAGTGDSFADFLMGTPVTGLLIGLPVIEFRSTQFTPFFQDSWRVTRNLTLNYGLSWFLETPTDPQGWARDWVHDLDRSTGQLRFAGLGQIQSNLVAVDRNNLSPRLGFAWKPGTRKPTVIRAGAGMYYSEFPWLLSPYPITSPTPLGVGQGFTNALTNPVPAFELGRNVFPPGPGGGLTSTYAANLPAAAMVTLLNPAYRTAYSNQWNFSIQHSPTANDFVELTYMGSSAHRLPNVVDEGQCRPGENLFCDPATRPWPRYGLMLYQNGAGNSSSNALLAKYEHRMSRGLSLRIEYSLAKALSDSWQAANVSSNQITSCRKCSKSRTNFDVRHRVVASAVWELPFARLHPWAGGWTVTGITVLASGQPFNLRGPNQTGSPFVIPLPNRVCDGRSDELSGNIRNNGFLWFDTACFSVPPVGYFGNSGQSVLTGPGVANWDIAVQKSFRIYGERARLQFRAEMFNTWNHAQFLAPNGDAGAGGNFGRISASRPPRLIQLAIKLLH